MVKEIPKINWKEDVKIRENIVNGKENILNPYKIKINFSKRKLISSLFN